MIDIKKKIIRIRTGGQSGVDRAAMDFAREWNIPLCGWCPKGGWAEDYPDPPGLLKDYPEMTETPTEDVSERTKRNMRDCDAILTIIPWKSEPSEGTEIGLEEGRRLGKPMFTAKGPEDVPEIVRWIRSLPDEIELCVGGPRASECSYAYDAAKAILDEVADTIVRNRMIITKEYRRLMDPLDLPERFHSGDFAIFDFEEEILKEFVDNFYEALEQNGYVELEDFTEFMTFLQILGPADTEKVQNILMYAFIKSNLIASALSKR